MVCGELKTDIVVLGSGVAGLTAALTASISGLDAIVLEHAREIGGTSARSSGTVWIPDNHYIREQGVLDDRESAYDYLASLVGNNGRPELWQAFLGNGPRMIAELESQAGIGFRPFMTAPDYRQDHPGAAPGGRALEPLPFDGRLLDEDFNRLAGPLPELMLFGGMMITRAEAAKLLKADRSLSSAWLGLRLVGRYIADRARFHRGTRLVLGNALVARLFKAATDRGTKMLSNVEATGLIRKGGRVVGVKARNADGELRVEAPCGVILAGGGFPASSRKRAEHLPSPVAEHTPAADGCDGSTIDLAVEAGAALSPDGLDNALWFPSSIAKRKDGSTAIYPHIVLDRSKPGVIAVDGSGRRFTNEAVSYHEFVRAMYRASEASPAIPAWLICDRKTIGRYGLGLVRPRTASLARFVNSGYLIEAPSISGLAGKIGADPEVLQATVARYNGFAETGRDEEFGKGESIYDRSNGDPEHRPNPCIGRIDRPPFLAVALWPTPLGTSRGLLANPDAQVLDTEDRPIPGLYACGNDMQSAFGGEYPGAGAQLGQAMTFGWLAARHAAETCDQRKVAGTATE
jgi:succinate dehydrogenase/fumarate reductase flavoprotein subunit